MARKLQLPGSELGAELANLRKDRGASIEQMAKAVGHPKITRQILYQYESGRLLPTHDRFEKIANAYAMKAGDEDHLWRFFREAAAVKLPASERDYVEGLLSVAKSSRSGQNEAAEAADVYVLEGRAVVAQDEYIRHRIAEFLLENERNRVLFIVPALHEHFDELEMPVSRKTSIYDWAQLMRNIKSRMSARLGADPQSQELKRATDRVTFYRLQDIFSHENLEKSSPLVRKACLELWRLCRPETTTSYAITVSGNAAGYICVEVMEDLYRWFWLSRDIVSRDLQLIRFLEQQNAFERFDVTSSDLHDAPGASSDER